MKKFYQYIALLAFFLVLFSEQVSSQDHHYWSQLFGSRSALMGGAVVGSVRDTSAGFYNPGALGFINEPSLSVSANAYRLERLSIENGVGTGVPLDSDQIGVVPLVASGTLLFDRFPNHVFGYSLLTKNQSTIDVSGRNEKNLELINQVNHADGRVYFEGEENFIGQMIASSKVTELWTGLTWAHKLRPHVSMGATAFFALRNQSQNETVTARAVNGRMIASEDKVDYVDFWNLRTLLKWGITADLEEFKLGLTITTPSRNLFGQGTVARERSFNNFYDREQGQFVGELVSNRQENLDTTYKTPLSIAAGFEFAVTPKTNLAASVEWFNKQPEYDVITPGAHSFLREIIVDEFIQFDETGEERALIKVKDAAERVVNFAVAIEHSFNKTTKGYFSFRTDHETNPNIEENSLGLTNWDIYHFTVGGAFRRKRSELALGLTYSFGKPQEDFIQFANFSNIKEGNLFGQNKRTTANYDAFSVIVGYTYFFDNN
jgi:hypothetical protein